MCSYNWNHFCELEYIAPSSKLSFQHQPATELFDVIQSDSALRQPSEHQQGNSPKIIRPKWFPTFAGVVELVRLLFECLSTGRGCSFVSATD